MLRHFTPLLLRCLLRAKDLLKKVFLRFSRVLTKRSIATTHSKPTMKHCAWLPPLYFNEVNDNVSISNQSHSCGCPYKAQCHVLTLGSTVLTARKCSVNNTIISISPALLLCYADKTSPSPLLYCLLHNLFSRREKLIHYIYIYI